MLSTRASYRTPIPEPLQGHTTFPGAARPDRSLAPRLVSLSRMSSSKTPFNLVERRAFLDAVTEPCGLPDDLLRRLGHRDPGEACRRIGVDRKHGGRDDGGPGIGVVQLRAHDRWSGADGGLTRAPAPGVVVSACLRCGPDLRVPHRLPPQVPGRRRGDLGVLDTVFRTTYELLAMAGAVGATMPAWHAGGAFGGPARQPEGPVLEGPGAPRIGSRSSLISNRARSPRRSVSRLLVAQADESARRRSPGGGAVGSGLEWDLGLASSPCGARWRARQTGAR